ADEDFQEAGAKLLASAEEVWAEGELVLKVKEPIASEYPLLRRDQVLFTYLHLAADRPLTEALLAAGTTAIAYETVQTPDGAKAPKLVDNKLVSEMHPGSVLVDIAIDQGGCFEDSHPTTHDQPTYRVHDSVFYCVANMPGAVPRTSTYALTNVTLPYAVAIAEQGWQPALAADHALSLGLNTHAGALTNKPVAQAHDLAFTSIEQVIPATQG